MCDSVDVSPDRSPAVREAIRQAVSVSIATGLYGVSFGALAVAAGLDLPQTAALSLLLFSGGSQFAFLGLVWPRLGTRIARAAAGLSIVVALGLTPFVPAGLPVLAAAAVAIVLGWSRPAGRAGGAT